MVAMLLMNYIDCASPAPSFVAPYSPKGWCREVEPPRRDRARTEDAPQGSLFPIACEDTAGRCRLELGSGSSPDT